MIACRKCDGKLKCISTRATLAGVTRRYQCHTCALRLSTREQIVAPRNGSAVDPQRLKGL